MSVTKEFSSSKPQKLTKWNDMTCPFFSKTYWDFKLVPMNTTKTNVALWWPIKLIPSISRGLNKKEMYLWAKLYCKVPQVRVE